MSICSSLINLVVFFALLCQIAAAPGHHAYGVLAPFWKMNNPMVYRNLGRIDSPSAYQRALSRSRDSFTRSSKKDLCAHPLLHDQTRPDQEPVEWLSFHLLGWDGDEATLLFRNDDMNLAGFANKSGTWFSFDGYEHLIPGSIPTGIRANFQDLVAGGWRNLNTIPLGEDALKLAVRNLSSGFDPSTASARDRDGAKVSAAQLMVMFPGALRFLPVRQKVMDGWESGSFLEDLGEKELLVSWKDFAASLMRWNETGQWKPTISPAVTRKYRIENEQDALRVVDLLFVPRRSEIGPIRFTNQIQQSDW